MIFDENSGFWLRGELRYIKNEYNPGHPVYIEVLRDRWTGSWNNQQYTLLWPKNLDHSLREAIAKFWKCELQRHAVSILSKYGRVLRTIADDGGCKATIEGLQNPEKLRLIWDRMTQDNRSIFRALVKNLYENHAELASEPIGIIIDSWKARRPPLLLNSILEWNPTTGSLSSSELETLRRFLIVPTLTEDLVDHFARLMIRIGLTTMRRTSQITGISAKGLHRISCPTGEEAMLQIPYAKAQTGREAPLEQIPTDLADDIDAYRARPKIRESAASTKFLMPLCFQEEIIPASTSHAKMMIERWLRNTRLISPRTGKPLHVTMRRLRHTGATHMAMQGYSADLIQDILQHDSQSSARSYIDAVGSEYLPIFEKADLRLGGKFSMMRDAWFNGKVISRPVEIDKPIIVPDSSAPAVVGSCASANKCPLHPLFSCYSCQEFLAFRDANHEKVLDFVEGEYERWRRSETSTVNCH